MQQKYEAIIEHNDELFDTLVIKYSIENLSILCSMNLTINEAISQFSINPENIFNINVKKEGFERTIYIKYFKFDLPSSFYFEDNKKQITILLGLLGFCKNQIISIEYEKKYPNIHISTEMIWIARISSQLDYDENFSKSSHELNMSKAISNALGSEVKVLIF